MGGVTLSSLSITLVCHAPFRPAGGGIVHNDMHGFCGLGGSWEPPWGHRESMRTPHRNALSPTPAKVWAPMTWRSRHITQCPQCPLQESNPERSCCEAAALPLRHCAPLKCKHFKCHHQLNKSGSKDRVQGLISQHHPLNWGFSGDCSDIYFSLNMNPDRLGRNHCFEIVK